MGKLDTAGIEFLEGDFGVGRKPVQVAKRKAVKKPEAPHFSKEVLQGVSSYRLVGELFKRHYVDLQVLGFWTVLAVIVWIKLG